MSIKSKDFNPEVHLKNYISSLDRLDYMEKLEVFRNTHQKQSFKLNDNLAPISNQNTSNGLKNKEQIIKKMLHKSLPRSLKVSYEHPIFSQSNKLHDFQMKNDNEFKYSVRFAVNGLSKFIKHTSMPPTNRDIQTDDFGDDAGMIAENTDSIVIGLADGAGGNRSIGIDPRRFSRSLLGYCVHYVKKDEVKSNEMAKLACKSIQILEAKNIEG